MDRTSWRARPVSGHLQTLWPYMEWGGDPANWMLFLTERVARLNPWVAETLVLIAAKTFVAPVMKAGEADLSAVPKQVMQARRVLAQPALHMSELVTKDFTLGSGWAFMDCKSRQLQELNLRGSCTMERFRLMDYIEDGYARLLMCFECHDDPDHIIFTFVEEISPRISQTSYGLIDRNTGEYKLLASMQSLKSCQECIAMRQDCGCLSEEVNSRFQLKYFNRRQRAGKLAAMASRYLGSDYYESWINGVVTIWKTTTSESVPYSVQMMVLAHGDLLMNSVKFVVQGEVLHVQPPRLCQSFVAAMKQNAFREETTWISNAFLDELPSSDDVRVDSRSLVPLETLKDLGSVDAKETILNRLMNSISEVLPNEERRPPVAYTVNEVRQSGPYSITNGKATGKEKRSLQKAVATSQNRKMCDICNKTFTRTHDLDRHHKTVHEKKRLFQCEFCPKTFKHSGHYNSHIKMYHEENRDHACTQCNLVFDAKSKLERHIGFAHMNLRQFVCPWCKAAFKDGHYGRRNHIVSQHGEEALLHFKRALLLGEISKEGLPIQSTKV